MRIANFLIGILLNGLSSLGIYAEISRLNVPKEPNVVNLEHIEKYPGIESTIKKSLDYLFRYKNPVEGFTTSEAKKYLSDFVKKEYGQEQGKELINTYFTDEYFMHPEEKKTVQQTPSEIADEDPFLFGHITNMLMYGIPGSEGTMEKARERWSPSVLLLSPREVFNAFINSWQGHKIPIKNFGEYKKKFPEQAEAIFSEKYFGIPEDPEKRKEYFLQQPFGFFTQELVKNIYTVAQRIMNATQPGDYIIIFGNTPYFVGRALQKLVSKDPSDQNFRQIIIFPFSGSPNRVMLMRTMASPLKNIVTPERFVHLKQRLTAVGLTPKNEDLNKHGVYFVDVIASGSGPAYVIEELIRMFQQAGKKIPDFSIISLNKIDLENERNALIAEQNADDGQKLKLYFPTHEKRPHFAIDAQVIYLDGHTELDLLPSDEYRILPEYNAVYWQPEFDYLLDQPKTRVQKILLEFFDTNLEYIMQKK